MNRQQREEILVLIEGYAEMVSCADHFSDVGKWDKAIEARFAADQILVEIEALLPVEGAKDSY